MEYVSGEKLIDDQLIKRGKRSMGFRMHQLYFRKRTASIIGENLSNLTVY